MKETRGRLDSGFHSAFLPLPCGLAEQGDVENVPPTVVTLDLAMCFALAKGILADVTGWGLFEGLHRLVCSFPLSWSTIERHAPHRRWSNLQPGAKPS